MTDLDARPTTKDRAFPIENARVLMSMFYANGWPVSVSTIQATEARTPAKPRPKLSAL
jgi:hypothetical protein